MKTGKSIVWVLEANYVGGWKIEGAFATLAEAQERERELGDQGTRIHKYVRAS